MHPEEPVEYGEPGDAGEVTLFLTGDVMTGRGIDQVLPHPCDPRIYEGYVKSALGYVSLAEDANGPIAKPVDFDYVWGDALAELDRRRPDARLINLETAVTTSDEPAPKGINYRMNPRNIPVITAAGVDCCVLANNHVLDWGGAGLRETLATLADNHIASVGAGRDLKEAARLASIHVAGGRVLLLAFGSPTAGVPHSWAAGDEQPGVNLLPHLDTEAVTEIAAQVSRARHPGDVVVVSLHWGSNWGYDIPHQQREFAHALIDAAGADIVWGHSSHHPKAIEVHNGRLILYGCGDFLNDYEGIRGYEAYRDDLTLMYLPTVRRRDGALRRLVMVPLRIRKFRLHHAPVSDARWLAGMLNREGGEYGTRVARAAGNELLLAWNGRHHEP